MHPARFQAGIEDNMTHEESKHLRKEIMGIIYDHDIDMSPAALLAIAEAIHRHEDDIQWDLDPNPEDWEIKEITYAKKNN